MTAYVIVDIEVTDPDLYEAYKKLAPAAVASYGGKYLARGGETSVLEGESLPHRLVILEFPSTDQAHAWWNSPEYAAAKEMRQRSARTSMVVIAGISQAQ